MTVPAIYEEFESDIRTYSRMFPVEFEAARGSILSDVEGRVYVDLMSAAGSVNYGHNNPFLKRAVLDYLEGDGPLQSLDLHTVAKTSFLEKLRSQILRPRGLDYKVQFAGPTGSNSIEAALKIARAATGRSTVASFTGGFHGGSLGALAISSNRRKREAAGVELPGGLFLPYDDGTSSTAECLAYVERVVAGDATGAETPAAFVLETVQGEGGLATASRPWIRGIAEIASRHGILLVVDDIQAGCGRTGRFFSFEDAGVVPDIVCLAKSIGGLGLPMALLLFRPTLDVLPPGAHAGTFRGQNLSFVAGAAALDLWTDQDFLTNLRGVVECLDVFTSRYHGRGDVDVRGRGAIRGLRFSEAGMAKRVVAGAFSAGVLVETSGASGDVVKVMPPLTTPLDVLSAALDTLDTVIEEESARDRAFA